jgi:hypothetical protein
MPTAPPLAPSNPTAAASLASPPQRPISSPSPDEDFVQDLEAEVDCTRHPWSAPDDLSHQHPPTSPAVPSLATQLRSLPLTSDVVSETQEAYIDMVAARIFRGSVAPRPHSPAESCPEFSRPRPWTSEFVLKFFFFFFLLSIRIASHYFPFCMISLEFWLYCSRFPLKLN